MLFVDLGACPLLKDPPNGYVFVRPDGTIATYSCVNNSFTLIGAMTVNCVNGTWSSPPPKCV